MEDFSSGVCLKPTFSPPYGLNPVKMSLHQKLTMSFELLKFQRKKTSLSLSQIATTTAPHESKEEESTKKESSSDLNLFDGAISYTLPSSEDNVRPQSSESNLELQEILDKSIETTKKRSISFAQTLNSSTNKRQESTKISEEISQTHKEVPDKAVTQGTKPRKPLQDSIVPEISKRDSFQSLAIAPQQRRDIAVKGSKSLEAQDFQGIQHICKNAGASSAGLNAFKSKCQIAKVVQLSLLFEDLSSNHAPSTVRYCKPSGSCRHWYCTCEKVIRANRLKDSLIAAIFVIGSSLETFLLPLSPCMGEKSLPGQRIFFPFKSGTTLTERFQLFLELLSDESIQKVLFHTQAALLSVFHPAAVSYSSSKLPIQGIFDPRIAAYLLNSDISDENLEMYRLMEQYQVNPSITNDTTIELGAVSRCLEKLSTEGKSLLRLHETLLQSLRQHSLLSLFWEIEMPLTYCLSFMEYHGVLVNISIIQQLTHQLQSEKQSLEQTIYQLSGFTFNISSPEQVSTILYERLGLLSATHQKLSTVSNGNSTNPDDIVVDPIISIQKKSKHYSTSEEELKKLVHLHPVVDKILSYRAITKLISTYIEGLTPFIITDSGGDPTTTTTATTTAMIGSIHAYWNQTGVRTGRLSCCKPNLQNIPSNQMIQKQMISIRNFFCAKSGFIFLTADYSQIEVRILAHVCQDPVMIELFQHEQDIYRQLAGKILNLSIESVPDSERNKAKTICLGILYGMGAAAAQKLGIEISQANQIITSFFQKFKHVRKWMESIKSQTKEYQLIKTLTGRIRHLPEIHSSDQFKRSAAERQAINSIIQGTASDIIKYAMVCMQQVLTIISTTAIAITLEPTNPSLPSLLGNFSEEVVTFLTSLTDEQRQLFAQSSLIMQIHDELIFHIPDQEDFLSLFTRLIREIMEREVMNRFQFRIPLKTNISRGTTWGSLIPLVNLEKTEGDTE